MTHHIAQGTPLCESSWAAHQRSRFHARWGLPNHRTTCCARNVPTNCKITRLSSRNDWYGPHSQARDAVQQRPSLGAWTKKLGRQNQDEGLPRKQNLPLDSPTNGPPQHNARQRPPLRWERHVAKSQADRRVPPSPAILKHNTKKSKLLSEPKSSTSVSMDQCVHLDRCHANNTASPGATPRRQTSDSPSQSVHSELHDKSHTSVCGPRVASWQLCTFLLSRLRAHRGAHARKFRVCVEKNWRSPPPFSLTLTSLSAQGRHLGHSDHKHPVPLHQASELSVAPIATVHTDNPVVLL